MIDLLEYFIKKWTIARQPWPTTRCPIWWRRRKLLPKFPPMMINQLLLLARSLAMLPAQAQVNHKIIVNSLLSNQLNIKQWPFKTLCYDFSVYLASQIMLYLRWQMTTKEKEIWGLLVRNKDIKPLHCNSTNSLSCHAEVRKTRHLPKWINYRGV